MPDDLLIRCIESVPCFPSQIGLEWLFPVKDMIKALVASNRYEMSVTKHKVTRNDGRFIRLFELIPIIIN